MVKKMKGLAQGNGCMEGGCPDRGGDSHKSKWQCV